MSMTIMIYTFIDPFNNDITSRKALWKQSPCLSVDTLLISKLSTPFVPICSHFRLYICSLEENLLRTKLTDLSAFP